MLSRSSAKQWLAEQCELESALQEAFLFGSFIKSSDTSADVDMMCIFNVRNVRVWSSQTKSHFLKKFGIPLHLQRFHKNDVEEIAKFLDVAKTWEKIV